MKNDIHKCDVFAAIHPFSCALRSHTTWMVLAGCTEKRWFDGVGYHYANASNEA